jgi:PIN domain nuclease of toxin-antitoxin system
MEPALLLDTCAAIWISDDRPMARQTVEALGHARANGETIYVSPIAA